MDFIAIIIFVSLWLRFYNSELRDIFTYIIPFEPHVVWVLIISPFYGKEDLAFRELK